MSNNPESAGQPEPAEREPVKENAPDPEPNHPYVLLIQAAAGLYIEAHKEESDAARRELQHIADMVSQLPEAITRRIGEVIAEETFPSEEDEADL